MNNSFCTNHSFVTNHVCGCWCSQNRSSHSLLRLQPNVVVHPRDHQCLHHSTHRWGCVTPSPRLGIKKTKTSDYSILTPHQHSTKICTVVTRPKFLLITVTTFSLSAFCSLCSFSSFWGLHHYAIFLYRSASLSLCIYHSLILQPLAKMTKPTSSSPATKNYTP